MPTEDEIIKELSKEKWPITRRSPYYRFTEILKACATYTIVIAIIGLLIFSPVLIGAAWYFLIVQEPISAAIIGVVCGLICDFVILMILN